MPTRFCLAEQGGATYEYVQGLLRSRGPRKLSRLWQSSDAAAIRSLRTEVRKEEGGGGMCHVMMEVLWLKNDWEGLSVSYLDPWGRVICCGHCINILPDGSLLDSTADQFGEGHDVRLLAPGDPEYGRYRPEFDEDFHPGQCEEAARFYWTGLLDHQAQDRMTQQLGHGWWLEDKQRYLKYLREQVQLGSGEYQAWIDDLLQLV